MSSFTNPFTASSKHLVRSAAIATLLGAAMIASPLIPAHAASATSTGIQLAQSTTPPPAQAADAPAQTKADTVEQRITDLHASLQITPAQDAKWNNVAQAMRQNAANMDKLVATNRMTPPQNMTAVGDLKSYEKFAQAHVNGLKNLIASFSKLYASMPDAQRKNADAVFQSFGHDHDNAPAHS
jgi:hypothetical protein